MKIIVICKVILKCSNCIFLFHAKIDFICINLFCFCSNDIPRKVWPRAKELMQQRPSTRLDFKESFDLQSTTNNANKKFDLRDGKVEVWLFVASAIFGAVFSLMIFQLLQLPTTTQIFRQGIKSQLLQLPAAAYFL